jgi:hypothetical protein
VLSSFQCDLVEALLARGMLFCEVSRSIPPDHSGWGVANLISGGTRTEQQNKVSLPWDVLKAISTLLSN